MNGQSTESLLAQQVLGDIAALRSTKAFSRYFLADVDRRIEECRAALCKHRITEADHSFWCGKLEVWQSLKTKLDQDEAANRNIAG